MNDLEKVKSFIKDNPNYKVSDIQRLLKRGYKYCFELLESIGER